MCYRRDMRVSYATMEGKEGKGGGEGGRGGFHEKKPMGVSDDPTHQRCACIRVKAVSGNIRECHSSVTSAFEQPLPFSRAIFESNSVEQMALTTPSPQSWHNSRVVGWCLISASDFQGIFPEPPRSRLSRADM